MMKTFKKAIAIAMTLVFILSLVPLGALAEVEPDLQTVNLRHEAFRYGRSDKNQDQIHTMYSYTQFSGSYHNITRYNFAGYEEILRNEGTSVSMGFVVRANASSKMKNFTIYVANDAADTYDLSKLSYNSGDALGFWDTTRPVMYAKSDNIEYTNGQAFSSGEIAGGASILTTALDENVGNSTVAFYYTAPAICQLAMSNNKVNIAITYDKNKVDNQGYVDELFEELAWEKLSADSAGSVTRDSKLPLKYKGANITWTSSNPEIVNPETGVITQIRGEEVPVELTASLSYTDFAGNTVTAEGSKPINITVAPLTPIVVKVSCALNRQIGVKYLDEPYPTNYTAYYYDSEVMYRVPDSGRGDTHGFFKFDLSDYLKEVEAATEIAFVPVNRNGNTTTNTMLTVLSNRNDNWTADITYNSAINSGMYTDPGYGKAFGFTIAATNATAVPCATETLTQAIKDAVAANPDEGLVSFRISARDWNGISMQGNPRLEITYYEDDLMTDDELKAAKKDKVQWSALTSQDMDNVVADLNLPATWYGAPVTWTSSDENVISSSGEVTVGSEAKKVTLTATVDDAVNTFEVTVPASKIALKSEYSHKISDKDGGSNLNYSAANIYANEDLDITPDVIIATYSEDGETLLDVTVKEDVTIKKGYTCVPSEYHYSFGEKVTKAIVVDDMTTLKPLGIAR